jgi:tRNA (guanosine-2'-O-)-methyltransferase
MMMLFYNSLAKEFGALSGVAPPVNGVAKASHNGYQPRMPRQITEERKERINKVLSRRQKDLTLVMDNIWDPHNVSAVLRSCDAFGVAGVHLYYTDSQWPDLGKKTSASAKKWIARTEHTDAAAMVGDLRAQGMQILRTGFSERARRVMDVDFTRPTAIILSNEHRGTSPELAELVPDEIYIPMQGMVQSFNVSVAAAIILYQAFIQRDKAGMYDVPTFSGEELDRLKTEWYTR